MGPGEGRGHSGGQGSQWGQDMGHSGGRAGVSVGAGVTVTAGLGSQ